MKITDWPPECLGLRQRKVCSFCAGDVGNDGVVFRRRLEGCEFIHTLEFAHQRCALRFAPELLDAITAEQCLDLIAARIYAAEQFNQPGRV